MSARPSTGAPLPFERRGAPATAAGISVAFHAALLFLALPDLTDGPAETPVLAAAKSDLALSIVRSAPSRTRPADEPDEPDEAPRPAPRTQALRRILAARAASPDAPPAPSRIAKAAGEPIAADRPEVEVLARAAYDSPGGIRAPRRLGDAKPRYPSACQGDSHRPGGCEGVGRYEVEVDADGRAVSARTAESAGCPDLDSAAALFFLHRARFEPATMDGLPVPWKGLVAVRFDLKERGAGRD